MGLRRGRSGFGPLRSESESFRKSFFVGNRTSMGARTALPAACTRRWAMAGALLTLVLGFAGASSTPAQDQEQEQRQERQQPAERRQPQERQQLDERQQPEEWQQSEERRQQRERRGGPGGWAQGKLHPFF